MDEATFAARHPDYRQAIEYALQRLHNELPPTLFYFYFTEGERLATWIRLMKTGP